MHPTFLLTALLAFSSEPQMSDLSRFPASVQPRSGRDLFGMWTKYHTCDGVDQSIQWIRDRKAEVSLLLRDDYLWYLHNAEIQYQYKVLDKWQDSWIYLREAADTSNYGPGRLQYLYRLRELIGPVNYYLGVMPRPDGEIFTLNP